MHIPPQNKMNTLNLHNQPVEKEHVLPNLYDFGFHILMFQGVINLLVVCKCLATTKSSIEVSEKHESARTFKEKLLANLMMVKNPSIRPPISWGGLHWVGGKYPPNFPEASNIGRWDEAKIGHCFFACSQPKMTRMFSGWWLNQPIWKICSSKWVHLPQIRGENKKYLKPSPRYGLNIRESLIDWHLFTWPLPNLLVWCSFHL